MITKAHRAAACVVTALLTVAAAFAMPADAVRANSALGPPAAAPDRPAVISHRIIGYSVKHHPIRAYQLGNPKAAVTVVALAAMHGNEQGGLVVLAGLRDGRPIHGVNLWVIPRDNPDGVLSNDRHNAHGVDLNRNLPKRWKRMTGWYYSGPRPASEPETRALMRFLNDVGPDYVVTFHSPLHAVDVRGSKDHAFARRLSKDLHLPNKSFNCDGTCHGTLSQWFDAHHDGACVTVEFGATPSQRYLHVRAPRGLLRAIGGHF